MAKQQTGAQQCQTSRGFRGRKLEVSQGGRLRRQEAKGIWEGNVAALPGKPFKSGQGQNDKSEGHVRELHQQSC